MRNFTGNGYGNAPRNSRELLMARLSKSFPDRSFDDENLFFDSLLEYEEDMRKRYDYLCQDQMKLADIFMANPRMAEFIGDVLGGSLCAALRKRHFGMCRRRTQARRSGTGKRRIYPSRQSRRTITAGNGRKLATQCPCHSPI